MIIVLEGPDGAGKTTFIDDILQREPNTVVEHFGVPSNPETVELEYLLAIFEAMRRPEHTIFDRLHWGEVAYGEVKRHTSHMRWGGFNTVNQALDEACALTVYLRVSAETSKRRIKADGDDYVDAEDMDQVIMWYNRMMLHCQSSLVTLDNNHFLARNYIPGVIANAKALANEVA